MNPVVGIVLLFLWGAPPLNAGQHHDESPAFKAATFNVSLSRNRPGQLQQELAGGESLAARRIAAILKTVRPDIVLLNEFDFDPRQEALAVFLREYLETDRDGPALLYPHRFVRPVNTGTPSGSDLDGDGAADGPGDAFGFGRHPGHYGMVLLSRYPILEQEARTFQRFLWSDMPGALAPSDEGRAYYDEATWKQLRLSSKSHWDVPIQIGRDVLHVLASHPTPPVFDGPEDRNGRRNHDEIRFWSDYLTPQRARYIYDDQQGRGGLPEDAGFVILGDLNADPVSGDGRREAIRGLLAHPRVISQPAPARPSRPDGQAESADSRLATADFGATGLLRVDYVLPGRPWSIVSNGVYWPAPDAPGGDWLQASDHRLVWAVLQRSP